MKKKKLKKKITILKCKVECAESATTFMEGKMEAYRIENEVLKERIKQLEERLPQYERMCRQENGKEEGAQKSD